MTKSIRISDDLHALAQNASEALGRSLAQQMEHWARLGAALEAAGLTAPVAMELLGRGIQADEFVGMALGRVPLEDGGLPMLKEQQRKDSEDVKAGLRSPESFAAFQKGSTEGFRIVENPESRYSKPGTGW